MKVPECSIALITPSPRETWKCMEKWLRHVTRLWKNGCVMAASCDPLTGEITSTLLARFTVRNYIFKSLWRQKQVIAGKMGKFRINEFKNKKSGDQHNSLLRKNNAFLQTSVEKCSNTK